MERLGADPMKKVCEIDAAEVYQRSGQMPWNFNARKFRLNSEWVQLAFTEPQRKFLEKHSYAARPHPKHSPTVEIFVNEQDITELDKTLMHLLF